MNSALLVRKGLLAVSLILLVGVTARADTINAIGFESKGASSDSFQWLSASESFALTVPNGSSVELKVTSIGFNLYRDEAVQSLSSAHKHFFGSTAPALKIVDFGKRRTIPDIGRAVPNPEPATMLLLGSGLAGIALAVRRRRSSRTSSSG